MTTSKCSDTEGNLVHHYASGGWPLTAHKRNLEVSWNDRDSCVDLRGLREQSGPFALNEPFPL